MPFGVVFFDIDGFKRFNDEHGHEAGDVALQTVARTLAATIRPHDSAGRWGGEEFLVILANVQAGALKTLAERLCRMVRHSRIHVGRTAHQVTLSGGATLAMEGDTISTLVDRADALMYTRKRAGGNGVTT
jgi:diguanylate cyclase (GGDEF)-like protein